MKYLLFILLSTSAFAETRRFEHSAKLSSTDYLMHSRDEHGDPVFDKYRTVDLGLQVGVGSDCGRINFYSTLQSSLKNVLNAEYFKDVGKDILAASPMLLTCYFSPTWCAILKHSQINANWLSQMRLNQCALIDKYVDSRVEDYYQERQGCVRKSIDSNGGNMEAAMESCKGSSMWQADLANWTGRKEKTETNRLIESSAKWAGFNDSESSRALNLVKAMVGDTVVSKGGIEVEYGPRKQPLSPRTYLQSIEKDTYAKLCKKILPKVVRGYGKRSVDSLVTKQDLEEISPGLETPAVDRQTIRALIYLPPNKREMACQKLSDAVAMTVFSTDANRSLDLLTTLSQNPNLPDNRKSELDQKRRALKESVELSVTLQRQKNEPLNQILSQINAEGASLQGEMVQDELGRDSAEEGARKVRYDLFDCADGVLCRGRVN